MTLACGKLISVVTKLTSARGKLVSVVTEMSSAVRKIIFPVTIFPSFPRKAGVYPPFPAKSRANSACRAMPPPFVVNIPRQGNSRGAPFGAQHRADGCEGQFLGEFHRFGHAGHPLYQRPADAPGYRIAAHQDQCTDHRAAAAAAEGRTPTLAPKPMRRVPQCCASCAGAAGLRAFNWSSTGPGRMPRAMMSTPRMAIVMPVVRVMTMGVASSGSRQNIAAMTLM